jgi:hypothetical protein
VSILKNAKENLTELFTGGVLFVGFPLVAWAYFDIKAALLTFCVIGATIGILALRSK